MQILGKDQYSVEKSIDGRGSGMRRLLMVSFFQYMSEKKVKNANYIYGIEEPENSLHPGLQRELFKSFLKLSKGGYQLIITSHSPVFAGLSPIEDLVLIKRRMGVARVEQSSTLDLSMLAEELGVEPSDQMTGYDACIFVEGHSDIKFLKHIATQLKNGGLLEKDFDDKNIGFIICGGDSLKHGIDLKAMSRLSKHYGVLIDSDKTSLEDELNEKKLRWKESCERQGCSSFKILRKRTIENYIHPDAIRRKRRRFLPYDDFTNMKDKRMYGNKVYEIFLDMTSAEILEADIYMVDGEEKHELSRNS